KSTAKDLNSSGGVLRTYNYGYDLAGNPTSATSPEGHVTKQTVDALNRTTSLIEPVSGSESITTSFGYDATGARTRLTDGRGNATWTSYNSLGLAETVTEPTTTAHPNAADRTWTHVYDQAGNPTATLQPGGVRIDRTFDHLDRLTKETGQGGGAASAERTLGYDLAGRQTTIGDLTVDYNDRNLPLSIKRGTAQQTGYSYDALGNPLQRVDAAGTATFTWDGNNRPDTATDPVTGRKITYRYDPAGNLASLTAATGTTTTDTQIFTYDDMDRLKTQTLTQGTISGQQLAKITYGWDKDDNLTTKTTAGTAGAGTNTYAYDHAGRLTSWTAPGGATTAYEWDAAGNRTKAGNATFTYDERNRLTSGDGTDYTYTARGTLASSTKAGVTTNYTFDAFDRLIADGDSLYSYDALDRMTNRIRGTAKQTFSYAGLGNDLAAITDSSGAVQAKYARDPGGSLLGLKEGNNLAVAALSDLHGDLVATYTTSLQNSTAYDPFGAIIAQTGAKTQLGYQGEYTDPDTGKVNMHARWYQPGTGTFTSRDTATLDPNPSVQANRYTYANASPMTGTDPTGHYTVINANALAGRGYTSGVDYQSAVDAYAQYGIFPQGWSSSEGGQCIGSCGRDEGSGPVACDIWSCSGAIIGDFVNIMTLEEMKRQNVLPNGQEVWSGLWDAPQDVIADIIARAYENDVQGIADLWADYTLSSILSSASGGGKLGPDFCGDGSGRKQCGKPSSAQKRAWIKAYEKAINELEKKGINARNLLSDNTMAGLANPNRQHVQGLVWKRFCDLTGHNCARAFSYVSIYNMTVYIRGKGQVYTKAERKAINQVMKAAEAELAKGWDHIFNQLSDKDKTNFRTHISEKRFFRAYQLLGKAFHLAVWNNLQVNHPKEFEHNPSKNPDFRHRATNFYVELSSVSSYFKHKLTKQGLYSRAGYVLLNKWPNSAIMQRLARGGGSAKK
ncbi:RHS repeat-associated core domain-containing protein, partial [Nonomuraea sp. NPDC046802]|uniref:RHS repeat domain-containing protein n=1 Tax=Nonomuraea sp. NPDC046802 TaxID=3154919 RepID=UPI0033F8D5BD